jgi:hypothetical protein
MNRLAVITLTVLVALMVAFGAGWFYGSRGAAAARAEETDAAYALGSARGALLEGRLELYSNNFGNAARRFDDARRQLEPAVKYFEREKATEPATALHEANAAIESAIQRAGRLEPSAHDAAASAQRAIDGVIAKRRPPRP